MAAAGSSGAARGEEEFSERELEAAAILADLPSIVRACNRRRRQQQKQQQQQARPEIPSWGRSRPRKSPAAPPAEKPAADDDGRNGAASPDTPLAFPEDDEHREASAAAAAEDEAKACAQQHKWAQEQRGVVASLSHEKAHLLKQIEDYRARLQTTRSTNDCLNQIHQNKVHKKRHRPEEEEDEGRRWRLQPRAAGRPPLDLNEPAEADAEDGKPLQTAAAQWFHLGHQQLMQLEHKAARRRRQEIRRAKAAASRMRRLG